MELLDDMCHMESRFGPFGDIVSFGARQVHSLHLMHHTLRNHFGCTCWYSQVKGLKWMLGSVCLEIVLILMQGRCTVCMEQPNAWKTISTHMMELLDDVCHTKSCFGLFGDSVSFGARQEQGLHIIQHRLRNHFGRTRWYSLVKGSSESSVWSIWRQC